MSFCRLFIVALCLCLFPFSAYADPVRIAIVDIEKLSSQSLAGQSIQRQLKERRAEYQKEFSARENNLMNAEKQLIELQNTLSAEAFAQKRKEFETQLLETRNLFQKRRNALDKGVGNTLSQLRKTIIEVVANISEKEGYNVVLSRDSVVIVETEKDITDKVMAALNSKLPQIQLVVSE